MLPGQAVSHTLEPRSTNPSPQPDVISTSRPIRDQLEATGKSANVYRVGFWQSSWPGKRNGFAVQGVASCPSLHRANQFRSCQVPTTWLGFKDLNLWYLSSHKWDASPKQYTKQRKLSQDPGGRPSFPPSEALPPRLRRCDPGGSEVETWLPKAMRFLSLLAWG